MKRHAFRCDICNVEKTHESDITTGYGFDSSGCIVCFACCADRDRAAMVANGHSRRLPLYLIRRDDGAWTVTNWPGTLVFPVHYRRTGSHNLGRTRHDVWFNGPDGYVWHGVQIGEYNTSCHSRRTCDAAFVLVQ